jgi:hypothetical protein
MDQSTAPDAPTPGPAAAAPGANRPEHVPEDVWDAKAGTVKPEMFRELADLRSLRDRHDARIRAVPETADGYEVALPEDIELSMEFEIDPANPLVDGAKAFAKEVGLTQAEFSKLLSFEVRRAEADVGRMQAWVDGEVKALGENPGARIEGLKNAVSAEIGPDLADALFALDRGAKSVVALEALLAKRSGYASGRGDTVAGKTPPNWDRLGFIQRMAFIDGLKNSGR